MLYPFTFKPILKKVIWGGSDICPFKGITPVENGVGESWELSHVEGNYSIVDNGELEGKSLDELLLWQGVAGREGDGEIRDDFPVANQVYRCP